MEIISFSRVWQQLNSQSPPWIDITLSRKLSRRLYGSWNMLVISAGHNIS